MAKKKVGIWIDQREAVLVFLHNHDEKILRVFSESEKKVGSPTGSRSRAAYGPQDMTIEAKYERKIAAHMKHYYEKIFRKIQSVDQILIIGPGTAKNELFKHLGERGLAERTIEIEPADKMTDPQIAALVRNKLLS